MPYVGAVPPEALKVTIKQGESGLDLTTASAVSLFVRKPSGAEQTWTCAIQSSTTSVLVVTAVYSGGYLDEVGEYRAKPVLTVPGGAVNCKAFSFAVKDWKVA